MARQCALWTDAVKQPTHAVAKIEKEEEDAPSTARAKYEIPPFRTSLSWRVTDRNGEWLVGHAPEHRARRVFNTHPDAYQLFRNVDPWLALEDIEEQPILVDTKEGTPNAS